MIERLRRVERHVRLVLMLAKPGREIVVPISSIFVENNYDGADIARKLAHLANVQLTFVPIANRLSNINAVERGCSERLHA